MSPVNNTALVVRFKNTAKANRIAYPQVRNTLTDIDVMSNKQRLAGMQPQYEALMSATIIVVRQDAADDPAALSLCATSECLSVARCRVARFLASGRRDLWLIVLSLQEIRDQYSDNEGDEFFHCPLRTCLTRKCS